MNEKALESLYKQLESQQAAMEFAEMLQDKQINLQLPLLEATIENTKRTIECIEKDLPLLQSWYFYGPEIYAAMDLHWYSLLASGMFGRMLGSDQLMKDLEETDKLPFSKDICTIQRMMIYAVENETAPVPTINISGVKPCDGLGLMSEAISQYPAWKNVPTFILDPPYWKDERAIDYYVAEFKRMVSFIEEHTGKKLDIDRLREVIKESNTQFELWMEYNELGRSVPCPHRSFSGVAIWMTAQNNPVTIGNRKGTDYIKNILADAENRVREKKGGIENEKIRLLWFDLSPTFSTELTQWLEQEWNATVVMDMVSYCPYTLIDPTSEESMFRGMAKRAINETPMVRQSQGTVDMMINDITSITRDYKIDCVIGPGHMGHKDDAASIGILREVCREIEVPFFFLEMDVWDPRYTTIDVFKDKLSQFFSTMDLG